MVDDPQKGWLYVEMPLTAYQQALKLQHKLLAAVKENRIYSGVVLALEHTPVFTLGRRGGRENLRVSEDFLKATGIDVIQVERGGNITFHGPGQLVIYPIINLNALQLGVADLVTGLEEVMIRTAAAWDITAQRNPANRGVWVGNCKLGSIGIAVKRSISFHGLSLNVNTDLGPFQWINPCGLQDVSITSMQKELSKPIKMDQVRQAMAANMTAQFDVQLISQSLDEIFNQ